MKLQYLRLRQFRNYEEISIPFFPDLNVIWGKNAQGKTNLVEAIYLLMMGRSFRTSKLQDLPSWGKDSFYLELAFTKNGISQNLSLSVTPEIKKICYNNTICRSSSSLFGILPGIFMPPDDDLVKGSPLFRRQFLDTIIAQSDPLYLHHLFRYIRALKQRNHLLKTNSMPGIEEWEEILSHSAVYLVSKRRLSVKKLEKQVQQIYPLLSGETNLFEVHYSTKAPSCGDDIKQYYKDLFRTTREKDFKFGISSVGPHRDEMMISFENKDLRTFGSEGQKRTGVASLRLAAWHLLKEELDISPIMIIDDLDASLDKERRDRFIDYTHNLGQVFITSTETPAHRGIPIEDGKILS